MFYRALPFLVLTACGGGGSSDPVETPVTPTTPAPPTITSEEEYCTDYTLYKDTTYSDGTVETELIEENSEDCGYVPIPEEGTPVGESYCAYTLGDDTEKLDIVSEKINHLVRPDRLQDYADGEGGIYTDRLVHIDQSCFVQMEKPADCPTTPTATGDSRYNYLTCDGVKQRSSVSFPFDKSNESLAVIDILIVIDSNLTEEDRDGMTVEDFVNRQIFEANHMYISSGTHTVLRLAGIKTVEVAPGDLYRQYAAFFPGRYEFSELDTWQREANADIAFLFKKKPDNAIACGVASLDATRGLDYTRGITQCFHNTTFQSTSTTRYYQRAHETFAHEVGHLLGAQHAWEDADTPGIFEYSFGYNVPEYNPQSENSDYEGAWGGYGTIMSYADLPTGIFSDYNLRCVLPETGQSVRFGTSGGCFCLDPIEEQPPATNNRETIQRTRWVMSQLHEVEHGIQFSTPVEMKLEEKDICLF